jgi:Flp pilus assembly protein TadB
MSNKLPQLIIMLSGATLIVIGVVLLVLQLSTELNQPAFIPETRSLETTPTGGFKLTTTYVGLVVLVIGATLEIVGYVASTPWRVPRSDQSASDGGRSVS